MKRTKSLVKRREKLSDIIKKSDKGIYIMTPYEPKADGTILFKVGVGFTNGLLERIYSYHTPFPHGTYVIALIVPDDNNDKRWIYEIEKFYQKSLQNFGFKRVHSKDNPDGDWVNRKEQGEWFQGKSSDLLTCLTLIEENEDRGFGILRSEYFEPAHNESDSYEQNDKKKWIYQLHPNF